jgi:hypothetical protein
MYIKFIGVDSRQGKQMKTDSDPNLRPPPILYRLKLMCLVGILNRHRMFTVGPSSLGAAGING